MKINIIVATEQEVEPFLELYNKAGFKVHPNNFLKYKNHEIALTITGAGMVNTLFRMGRITGDNFDVIINVGICGSFDKKIKIGTVVNVMVDTFADIGAEDGEKFLTIEELNLGGPIKIGNDKCRIKNKTIDALPKVNGITVNTVHGNKKSIEKVKKKFNPEIETMEGAAFMYYCDWDSLQYVQIRAVSNYVEERNTKNWNIPLAVKNLNTTLMHILDTIKKPKLE